ncbi:hypothetical protein DERP_001405 [Dermatophagoides pteronyssinus]|uniref:Uncharacterized protein n=1 Tax=Dermatophagoides pteronyssinus TaxID=6956 RepID=A0ABQ8JED6_DERPT|nr:hypothetical protein DERP_001405 [Dermatophagoides pteronyssinus]
MNMVKLNILRYIIIDSCESLFGKIIVFICIDQIRFTINNISRDIYMFFHLYLSPSNSYTKNDLTKASIYSKSCLDAVLYIKVQKKLKRKNNLSHDDNSISISNQYKDNDPSNV